MADISKIQIESGIYDIKDEVARSKKHMVVIGDSFSTTTYNPVESAWYTIVANKLYLNCHNYAQDSAGYVHRGNLNKNFSDEVDDAINDNTFDNNDVRLVIVYGGLNDMNTTDTPSLTTNANALFTKINNNFPNAKIVCMGINSWFSGLYNDNQVTSINYFLNIRRDCAGLGIIFIFSSLWLLADSNCYDSINGHPNVYGNAVTATNVLSSLYGSPLITCKEFELSTTSFTEGSGMLLVRYNSNTIEICGTAITSGNGYAEVAIPKNLITVGIFNTGNIGIAGTNKFCWIQWLNQNVRFNGENNTTYYYDIKIPIF
jgi:hypothetical protein